MSLYWGCALTMHPQPALSFYNRKHLFASLLATGLLFPVELGRRSCMSQNVCVFWEIGHSGQRLAGSKYPCAYTPRARAYANNPTETLRFNVEPYVLKGSHQGPVWVSGVWSQTQGCR